MLAGAQGESVKIALDASEKPVECEVIVDGKPRGIYKGRTAEHLQRVISIRMEEGQVKGTVEVREKAAPPDPSAPQATPGISAPLEPVAATTQVAAGEPATPQVDSQAVVETTAEVETTVEPAKS